MLPIDFMRRVMAWPGENAPGYVNLHWTKDGKWRGRPYKTVEPFMNDAAYYAGRPGIAKDIYFCLTTQSQTGKVFHGKATAMRSAANATLAKALWLDVDIKEPPRGYATLGDAIDAINVFCAQANLPPPSALVGSGGGLHVYWIFAAPMSIADWRPYALGLKKLAEDNGLRADYGVTADPARVLRVPGTFNRKLDNNPRPVKLLSLGNDYFPQQFAHLAALGQTLLPTITAPVTAQQPGVEFDLTGFGPPLSIFGNPMVDVLGEGCKRNTDLPLDPTNMIKQCPHFLDVFTNRGAGQPQGVWMLDVLASTWLFNGREWATNFSSGYHGYDKTGAELDAMWARKMEDKAGGKGWPGCHAFESQGCTSCKTCPLKGTIKSPLNLADRIREDPAATPFVPPTVAPLNEALLLPFGYTLNDENVICIEQADKEDKETGRFEPQPPIPLFHDRVVGHPFCSDGPNGPELHFIYEDDKHSMDVSVPFAVLGSDQQLATCLAGQGVMVKYDKPLRDFMRSWISLINKHQKRQASTPFGWVFDGPNRVGFAYGGRTFYSNGQEDQSVPPDRAFAANYTPRGDTGPILRMMDINRARNNPGLDVLELASWASPLLYVTGEGFSSFWTWGGGSGAGKSTAIMTGMALWSSPGKTKENGFRTSAAGFERKMGQLVNLPLVADELTSNELIDKLIPLIQMASEMQSGQMAKRNKEGAWKPTWNTIMVMGSNKSLHERQVQVNGGTNAHCMRVLEFEMQPSPSKHTQHEVSLARAELDQNYGGLGLAYAKYLAMNIDAIAARGKQINDEIAARVNNTHDERFWMAGATTIVLAAELANTVLGTQMYDRDKVKEFLIKTILANRAWVAENVQQEGTETQAEIVLARFIEAHTNNQLATDQMNLNGGRPKGLYKIFAQPAVNSGKGNVVHLHWGLDQRMLRIHLPEFRAFITNVFKDKATTSQVVAGLKASMGATQVRKVDMLAGTKLLLGQLPVDVLQIHIPEGSFLAPTLEKFMEVEPATVPSAEFAQQDAAKADLGGAITAAVKQAQQDLETVKSS